MPFGRYFVPGPSEVHPDVLAAMAQPMIHHRSPEAAALFERIQPGLREIFGTRRTVHVLTSSGTGAIEAGLRCVPPGRVLSLVNGAFSERGAKIAEACGHAVTRSEVPMGSVHDPDTLDATGFDAVTVCHSETSTGALQPIAELAKRIAPTPLLVDTVSSAGGVPVDFDASGLAFTASGSQKALALPPGLAFAVFADILTPQKSSFYFDLDRYEKKPPPFTPALPQVYALAFQLERIEREGVEDRFARHRAMAERTWAWAEERGLEILASEGARSPTVTCVVLPATIKGPDFCALVAQQGFTVGAGYGELKATTFRIGHMGDQTLDTLEELLRTCDTALSTAG